VVTVEDTPERLAIDTISDIFQTEGVLNASLVYQYTDDEISHRSRHMKQTRREF